MKKIRVAQCWDDGCATDIRLIEILKKHNAKATFNLCPGIHPAERIDPCFLPFDHRGWSHRNFSGGRCALKELRQIYGDFQVASHCWKHENAVVPGMTCEVFLEAAVKARTYLEDVFEKECRGFVWPCGGTTPETAKALEEAGFLYGRTTRNAAAGELFMDGPLLMRSSCHFLDGGFMLKLDECLEKGEDFYFWGHTYEMFLYDHLWNLTEKRIEYISNHPDMEWVDVKDLVK